MNFKNVLRLFALSLAISASTASQAGFFSGTLGEFNGNGTNTTETWGTMTVSITPGDIAVSAVMTGSFGNDTFSDSTSVHAVYADGIEVARCASEAEACWIGGGPFSWSYTFTGAELDIFTDGEVIMTTTQFSPFVVREGFLSLRGESETPSGVPEPSTYGLVAAALFAASAISRRRRRV